MPNLSQPFPTQTLDQLLASYTDPANIAKENDPLKHAFMVIMFYADVQGGSIQVQSDETKKTTDELSRLNASTSWLNDASGRLQTMQDTDFTWIGPNQWLQDAPASGDLSKPTFSDVAIAIYQANGTVPSYGSTKDTTTGLIEYTLTKPQVQSVSKNAQVKVDTTSSTLQQDQSFSQMLVGRYTATLTAATSLLEKIRTNRDNPIQNMRR
jgi:hypothetical protein